MLDHERIRHSRRTLLGVLLLSALPWSVFLLAGVDYYPLDAVAILLPVLVAVLVLIVLVVAARRRDPRWLIPAVSLLVVGLLAVGIRWLPADAGAVRPDARVSVLGANVMNSRAPAAALLRDDPDVLVMSEATRWTDPVFAAKYPYRELELGAPAVAVYSRSPLRRLDDALPALPGMRLRVDGPAGRFVLYALHVPRPWFTTRGGYQASLREHHQIIAAVAAQASKETDPVIVVGDLNTSDRTYGYQQLLQTGGLVDAVRDRWTRYSSVGKWTPLLVRIDHILVSRGWCGDGAGQVALPGSDHRGVLATVGPCLPAATP